MNFKVHMHTIERIKFGMIMKNVILKIRLLLSLFSLYIYIHTHTLNPTALTCMQHKVNLLSRVQLV